MKTNQIFKHCLAFTVFLLALSVRGQGTFEYDQQSVSSDVLSGVVAGLQQYAVGQSFTPTLDSVGFIRLFIGDTVFTGSGATVYVNLRSDSITGPILASSDPVALPAGYTTPPLNFLFSTPVSVIPGVIYYFDVLEQAGDNHWGIFSDASYHYPGGTIFLNGVANPSWDLWFREGIVVPEPSSALLLLAGVGALAVFRRAKTKANPQ